MVKEHQHRLITLIIAFWVILMPLLRAHLLAGQMLCPFSAAASRYMPEFAAGAVFLLLLPGIWRRKRWMSPTLVALALLLPLLQVGTGRITVLWFISSLLLLLLAYTTRSSTQGSVFEARRGFLRALMVLTHTPMYIATPSAYLQLAAGVAGAVDGFRRGHVLLAVLLQAISLLALYGLWTVWSISARLWTHGAYVELPYRNRGKDVRGLVVAWIALIGFFSISKLIFRIEEVVIFSILLGPALVLTSVALLVGRGQIVDAPPSERSTPIEVVRRLNIRHYIGVICGIAAGVLGIEFLVPSSSSGWGPCEWTIMFPVEGYLWPEERMIVFDACNTGLMYQTMMFGIASIVFWMAGAIAVAVSGAADPRLGAIAASVAAAAALAWAISLRVHIDWVLTLGIATAVLLWAIRLGYLGGLATRLAICARR